MSAAPPPAALAGLDPARIVDLDVREDLRAGREPFGRIMAARKALAPDGVLRLRATFEPAPLYAAMGRQGFAHWTERLADDDWRVWFHRAPGGDVPAAADAAAPPGGGGVEILDVRGLEPPEPMVRTLAALERLPAGATLVQLNVRVPRFLLPRLEERGFRYEVREEGDDLVRLSITRDHTENPMSDAVREPMQLDVRVIPPREKHPTIFRTFDRLAPGESFVLVNDHDPFPLRYQFEAERPGAFGWTYLEQGPELWRVEIRRG